MARHGIIGTTFAAAGTVGFFLSTYHFNRVHKDKVLKDRDVYIGHVEGFGKFCCSTNDRISVEATLVNSIQQRASYLLLGSLISTLRAILIDGVSYTWE